MARRLERAGVGAIVLPSLFEEEILAEELELTRSLEQGTEVFAEALDYFPAVESFAGAADRYLAALERVKAAVTIPVIASLNASSVGGWVTYARRHPGRRRGRARAQPVPRRGGSAAVGGRHGGARPRAHRGRPRLDHDPARGQAQPVLLGVRQLRRGGCATPAPTASCCSTASTSPTSTSSRSRSCRGSS